MSRCAYLNCKKTSRDISVFKFPVHDKERLLLWISHSGNTNLTSLNDTDLSYRVICAAHFLSTSIHRSAQKCRLIGKAVPIHYQLSESDGPSQVETVPDILSSLKVQTPTKFYIKKSRPIKQEDHEQSSSTSPPLFEGIFLAPSPPPIEDHSSFLKKRKLKEKCEKPPSRLIFMKTQEKLQIFRRKIKGLQSKLHKLKRLAISRLDVKKFGSENSKTLALMQFKKKVKEWTKDEKNLCLSLYKKSPAAYKFLRKQGVVLASWILR